MTTVPPASPAGERADLAGLFNQAPPTPASAPTATPPGPTPPETQWTPAPPATPVPNQMSSAARPVPTDRRVTTSAVFEVDEHQLTHPLVRVPGRPAIERLLTGLVLNDASDLHLVANQPPWFRIAGDIKPVAGERPVSEEDIALMLEESMSPVAWDKFLTHNGTDTSYRMHTDTGAAVDAGFRVNILRELGRVGAVIRVIPSRVPTADDLNLLPQIRKLAYLRKGLVMFVGETGSGKSTSQAAILDEVNTNLRKRIFTLEDPVEFVHTHKKSLISHREIGHDAATFEDALREVRREDPDVILVGEMRDYTSIAATLEAANTGHLVFATLHANSAPDAILRIVDQFPGDQQNQIRTSLAANLRSVVAQVLVPSPVAPRGRVLANEVLMVNAAVSANIKKNDISAIRGTMTDRSNGNITFDVHLAELIRASQITKSEALKFATTPETLEAQLGTPKRAY